MDVTIGQLIDSKYRIVRMLGQGGMGAVYEGENVRIHHRVAIKVLHAGIATNHDAIERFEREAQAAGKIGSDHIVEVFDLGELANGARYMVMEYLEGENLSSRIQTVGRMTAQSIAPIMMQLLEGLGAAHAAGIVHRDLKPDNVFLVRSKSGQDFVKIVDFGVSKFNKLSGDSAMSMTRTGAVIGTPYYMSPEQAKGAKSTDHRSDLYSVGVVLYECATGQVPFQADTFNELMFKIVLETPPDPETLVQGLDPRFAAIIKKAMAREPEHRYQTAVEFQKAITDWMGVAGASTSGAFPQQVIPSGGTFNITPNIGGSAEHPALAKTTGSIANVAAPVATTQSTSRNTGMVAGIAVAAVVLLAAGGVVAMKLAKGKSAASTDPTATTAAAVIAPPVVTAPIAPPAIAPTASAPAAATVAASASAATSASAASAATTATAAATATATSRHASGGAPPKASAAASASAGAASTAQVKGRTIRTDL